METQTQSAPTPVSFDDISLTHLTFNETYRVARGSASQVVLGLQHMLSKLSTPSNEYQTTLYPRLSELTQQVVSRYVSTFLGVSDNTERQVFGANLNGSRNDGSLYHSVNSGVNRSLTYGYAQFGQLMKVLTNRLRFVVRRDPASVQRYVNSESERTAYVSLQSRCNEFLQYLTTVNEEWTRVVEGARQQHNIQPVQRQRTPRTGVPRTEQTVRTYRQRPQQSSQPASHTDAEGFVTVVRRRQNQTRGGRGRGQVRHHRPHSDATR